MLMDDSMCQAPQSSHFLSIFHLTAEPARLTLSSRWEYSDNGAVWSGWASSSIKFLLTSPLSSLFLKIGSKTERKNRWNGGTPMIAVSVTHPAALGTDSDAPSTRIVRNKTFDAVPGTIVQLWDDEIADCLVEIVLIDWASMLEIDGSFAPSMDHVQRGPDLPADPQILFIGDSITCGLALEESDGGQPIPRGILDAFPSRTLSILAEEYSYLLSLDVVAYPGISLVGLHAEDNDAATATPGMTNPWDSTPCTPRGTPKFICIALGTNDEANDIDPKLFRSTLKRFIRTLVAMFPSAEAFYIIPPFRDFNEPGLGEIHNDLVSTRFIVADLDVKVYDIGSGLAAEHTVDGLHPTLAGHTILAHNLARFLSAERRPRPLRISYPNLGS
ncbi:SGNH hydrolase-type esterase domain-containing protein [Mycena galericulata]|nr:SGNH hydrolase-type esterase domain-containing protein [Mycena galericulata]